MKEKKAALSSRQRPTKRSGTYTTLLFKHYEKNIHLNKINLVQVHIRANNKSNIYLVQLAQQIMQDRGAPGSRSSRGRFAIYKSSNSPLLNLGLYQIL